MTNPESPVSLALVCGTCGRDVSLSYTPGPKSNPTMYFCPYCHKVNRLEIPGQIRGVTKAHNEKF